MHAGATSHLVRSGSGRRVIAQTFVALGMITVAFQPAFADAMSDRVDKVLSQTVVNAQKMAQLVDQGCSGGEHGLNPIHQDMVLTMSADVANKINDIRLALAKGGDLSPQVQTIASIDAELQRMTDVTHNNCQGGPGGEDPQHYGDMVRLKDKTIDTLDTLKQLFM